jgi:hypothetical protein
MSIEVMIKRKIQQGPQAGKVVPLILQLRTLATYQPGYIKSGRLPGHQRMADLGRLVSMDEK